MASENCPNYFTPDKLGTEAYDAANGKYSPVAMPTPKPQPSTNLDPSPFSGTK